MPGSTSGRPKLTDKQEQTIAALLICRTHEEAARTAGIATTTLQRWFKLREFQAAYREARRMVLEQTIARLIQLHKDALKALHRNVRDRDSKSSNRAADLILAHTFRALDLTAMEERIAALEEALLGGGSTAAADPEPGPAPPELPEPPKPADDPPPCMMACVACRDGWVSSPPGIEDTLTREEADGAVTLSGSWVPCPVCGTSRCGTCRTPPPSSPE